MKTVEFTYLDALNLDIRLQEQLMQIALLEASGVDYDSPKQEELFIQYFEARTEYEKILKMIDREEKRSPEYKRHIKKMRKLFKRI